MRNYFRIISARLFDDNVTRLIFLLDQKSWIYFVEDKTARVRNNTRFHSFSPLVLHFQVSVVMETPGSPFSMTSESNLYSTTARPNSDAYDQSMNETDDYILYVTETLSIFQSSLAWKFPWSVCLCMLFILLPNLNKLLQFLSWIY